MSVSQEQIKNAREATEAALSEMESARTEVAKREDKLRAEGRSEKDDSRLEELRATAQAAFRAFEDEKRDYVALLDQRDTERELADLNRRAEDERGGRNIPARESGRKVGAPGTGEEIQSDEWKQGLRPAVTKQLNGCVVSREARTSWDRFMAASGLVDQRPSEVDQRAMSSWFDTDLGYAAPVDLQAEIIRRVGNAVPLLERVRTIRTNRPVVSFLNTKIPEADMPRIKFGGKNADTNISVRDVADILGRTNFTLTEYGEIVKVPEQLVEDVIEAGFDLTGFLADDISQQKAEQNETMLFTGSGNNEPWGLFNSPLITVNSTEAGADFSTEDVAAMPYEIRSNFRSAGVFVMARQLKASLLLKRDDGGATAGTGGWLLMPNIDVNSQFANSDLIRFPTGIFPVFDSEQFPYSASPSTGDTLALFLDPRQYVWVERLTLAFRVLDQTFAAEGKIGYKWRDRVDGAMIRPEAGVRLLAQ